MKLAQYEHLARTQEDVLRYFLKQQAEQVFLELRAIATSTPYTYLQVLEIFKQFWELDQSRQLGLPMEKLLHCTRESAALPDITVILRAWREAPFLQKEFR